MAKYTTFDTKTEGIVGRDYGADYVGKRYQFLVWDQNSRQYQAKRYADKADGLRRSRDLLASFMTGQDTAGRVTLKSVIPDFVAALRGRGCTEGHITEIEDLLERGVEFGITNLKSPSIIKQTQQFIGSLKCRKNPGKDEDGNRLPYAELSDSSRHKFVSHFRALGAFCCNPARRWLAYNPFTAIERKSPDRVLQRCFGYEECARLVSDAALGLPEGAYWATRLLTGMRYEEAAWLRWSDVHFDAKRLKVALVDPVDEAHAERLGVRPKDIKRRKERLSILFDLPAWILRVHCPVTGPYVFPDRFRERQHYADWRGFHRHCATLGIRSKGIRPHSLRGSFASMLLAAGLDAIQLRLHLGHDELMTTEKYAGNVGLFREQCKDWKGEIRLREIPDDRALSNRCLTAAASQGASVPTGADEGLSDFFVLIPDNNELYRETVLGMTGTCSTPGMPSRRSMIPCDENQGRQGAGEDSDLELSCPS